MFFFKQKTAYEVRISDWSSDVCSSDLHRPAFAAGEVEEGKGGLGRAGQAVCGADLPHEIQRRRVRGEQDVVAVVDAALELGILVGAAATAGLGGGFVERDLPAGLGKAQRGRKPGRSEEHTSELQSLMRISYAVFCLKKKK